MKLVSRARRGRSQSRTGKGQLRLRKVTAGSRGRVKRKRSVASARYKSAFNKSYNRGYNAGFAKGFEDGHQLAYEQQI